MDEVLNKIKGFIKENMGKEFEAHNYQHAFRVYENALKLLEDSDECNKKIVLVSAIVHDFVDQKLYKDIPKQEKMLKELLQENNFSDEEIEEIFNIINNISYSKGKIPNSLEGKIVQDADRMDALLAFGVLRPFTYGVKNNRELYDDENSSLGHYIEKKLKLEGMLNTKRAKEIVKEYGKITYIYLAYLLHELPDDIVEKKKYKEELDEFYNNYFDIIPLNLIPKDIVIARKDKNN